MSVVPSSVYANPTTPCFVPAGGGGGSGPTGPTGPTGPSGGGTGGGLTNPVDYIEFAVGTGQTGTVSQRIRTVEYPYNSATVIGIVDVTGSNLANLSIGDALLVQQSGPPTGAAGRMLYKWNGMDFQEAGSGTTIPFFDVNTSNVPPVFSLTNVDAFSQKFGTTDVLQPKIQSDTFASSGASGSNTVTLSFPYKGAASYVVHVTMEDSNTAQMSALRVSSNSFDVYWSNASAGSHAIMWTTLGDA